MSKATYFLFSWNHGDIMLKPTERTILKLCFLFYHLFFHFSFSAISQACFHVRRKLVLFHFISLILIYRKNIMGEFLNSYGIIHSFVAFACCWSMLLCCDLTVNWFLILFASVELFLTSKTEVWPKSQELKVKYSWINMFPVHLYFLKPRPGCFIQN